MVQIQILNNTTLAEVRKAFKDAFPMLDLGFFSKPHEEGTGNLKKHQLSYDLQVAEAGDPHKIGLLQITADQTVSFTEQELENGFGLHAQVLRKSGNLWLQTTNSDNITLQALQAIVETENAWHEDAVEPEDYHEQE